MDYSDDVRDYASDAREAGRLKRLCRRLAGAEKGVTVKVVEGHEAPQALGEAGYHTTPAGTYVQYPNAYSRKGRVVYHQSTLRVEVGRDWLLIAADMLLGDAPDQAVVDYVSDQLALKGVYDLDLDTCSQTGISFEDCDCGACSTRRVARG